MSDDEDSGPWPFPSARASELTIPGEGQRISLTQQSAFLNSYLNRFGCVPVMYGNQRKLATFDKDKQDWVLRDPSGATELEKDPRVISEADDVMTVLTDYNWFHIGYNVNPQLIEIEFNKDGTGFSRYATWGHNGTTPSVEDYYWTFRVADGILSIQWEGEDDVNILFTLTNHLRAAGSLHDGHLSFYDMVLGVSAPLFPPSCSWAKYLLKEYWGKSKNDRF